MAAVDAEEVLAWLREMVPNEVTAEEPLHQQLRSGTVLCHLLNVLKPGCCKPPSMSSVSMATPVSQCSFAGEMTFVFRSQIPFNQHDNIAHYLRTTEALGVNTQETFKTAALYENRSMDAVIRNLSALRRICPTPMPAESTPEPVSKPAPEPEEAAAPAAAPPLPSVLGALAAGYAPKPVYSPVPPSTPNSPSPPKKFGQQTADAGSSEANGTDAEAKVALETAEPPAEATQQPTSRSRQASGLPPLNGEAGVASEPPEMTGYEDAPSPVVHAPILISTGSVELGGAPTGPPAEEVMPAEEDQKDLSEEIPTDTPRSGEIPSDTPSGSPYSTAYDSTQLPSLLADDDGKPTLGQSASLEEERMREQARVKRRAPSAPSGATPTVSFRSVLSHLPCGCVHRRNWP